MRLEGKWVRKPDSEDKGPWYIIRKGAPNVVEISSNKKDAIAFHPYIAPPKSPFQNKETK